MASSFSTSTPCVLTDDHPTTVFRAAHTFPSSSITRHRLLHRFAYVNSHPDAVWECRGLNHTACRSEQRLRIRSFQPPHGSLQHTRASNPLDCTSTPRQTRLRRSFSISATAIVRSLPTSSPGPRHHFSRRLRCHSCPFAYQEAALILYQPAYPFIRPFAVALSLASGRRARAYRTDLKSLVFDTLRSFTHPKPSGTPTRYDGVRRRIHPSKSFPRRA